MSDDEYRVWIGCLACYNDGRLVGQWFDAENAAEVTVSDVHAEAVGGGFANHEELWVFDTDNAPHRLLSKEMSPADAQAYADVLAELETQHIEPAAFGAYVDLIGEEFTTDNIAGFEDAYCGEWDSEIAYAQDLADDIGAVSSDAGWPNGYIDWERATRDLFMDYSSTNAPSGGVYVFRP